MHPGNSEMFVSWETTVICGLWSSTEIYRPLKGGSALEEEQIYNDGAL